VKSKPTFTCCGILLAAGQGKRFDASGAKNKLLHVLPSGLSVGASGAKNLKSALPFTLAVLSAVNRKLGEELQLISCASFVYPDAHLGMAHSLVSALQHAQGIQQADAFVIALADMPYVRIETINSVAFALEKGAGIVAPVYQGRRGNPVGFSSQYLPHLLALQGDQGARHLLREYPVTEIEVDDPGVLRDIDVPGDLN
jgi:molybdenum cofactor cytidylyltransferase